MSRNILRGMCVYAYIHIISVCVYVYVFVCVHACMCACVCLCGAQVPCRKVEMEILGKEVVMCLAFLYIL